MIMSNNLNNQLMILNELCEKLGNMDTSQFAANIEILVSIVEHIRLFGTTSCNKKIVKTCNDILRLFDYVNTNYDEDKITDFDTDTEVII